MKEQPSISVILPVLHMNEDHLEMTISCIKRMRARAYGRKFQLVVIETLSKDLNPKLQNELQIDQYIHFADRTRYTKDFNAGVDLASGDYLVHTGNDVLVNDGWLDALLEPFEKYTDCGVSSLSAVEPKHTIGLKEPMNLIVEGMYGPIMMCKKDWRLDEEYIGAASDNDLIMRLYTKGFRAYRNYASVVEHESAQTWKGLNDTENMRHGIDLFYKRWAGSPWLIFMLMKNGVVQYGHEHLAVGTGEKEVVV